MQTQDRQTLLPTEVELLKEKTKGIHIAMMTTFRPDGDFHTRPMAAQDIDPDGTMWFFTIEDTNKVDEVQGDNRVSLAFSNPGSDTYVVTYGTAEIVRDRQKIDELWSPVLATWFPGGKDDPNLALIRITTLRGEYWDRVGGKMTTLFEMMKGALTGRGDSTARSEKFGQEV